MENIHNAKNYIKIYLHLERKKEKEPFSEAINSVYKEVEITFYHNITS